MRFWSRRPLKQRSRSLITKNALISHGTQSHRERKKLLISDFGISCQHNTDVITVAINEASTGAASIVNDSYGSALWSAPETFHLTHVKVCVCVCVCGVQWVCSSVFISYLQLHLAFVTGSFLHPLSFSLAGRPLSCWHVCIRGSCLGDFDAQVSVQSTCVRSDIDKWNISCLEALMTAYHRYVCSISNNLRLVLFECIGLAYVHSLVLCKGQRGIRLFVAVGFRKQRPSKPEDSSILQMAMIIIACFM